MAKRKRMGMEEVQVQPRLRHLRTVEVLGVPVFSVTGGKKHAAGMAEDNGVPFYLADILAEAGFLDEGAGHPMFDRPAEILIRDATPDEKDEFTEDMRAGKTLVCGYNRGMKLFKMDLGMLINPEDLKELVDPPVRT